MSEHDASAALARLAIKIRPEALWGVLHREFPRGSGRTLWEALETDPTATRLALEKDLDWSGSA